MASLPEMVKPVWIMKPQACAVIQSSGVRADGAYREDGPEPERPIVAGVVPNGPVGNA